MKNTFDYVIVGAGTAGCVLAKRLSEDYGIRILVLEAGGWDRDPFIHIPLGFGRNAGIHHDWLYRSEPDPAIDGRTMEQARGKVIGGCSSVNAMTHVRGHHTDYDRWASSGLTEWSYRHALPYFKKQESWEGGENFWRGGSGPISIQKNGYVDPVSEAFAQAGVSMGYQRNDDYNAYEQDGFALHQVTIGNGRRCSAAVAYLRPALASGNVQVITKTHVTRVLMNANRATGVQYMQNGKSRHVFADREVILCGGVINSPQLLMLSGIGDPIQLKEHGIPTHVNLPGVGKNLQDQVVARIAFSREPSGPFHHMMRLDRAIVEFGKAYLFGQGMATSMPSAGVAFVRSKPGLPAPDLQIVTAATPHDAYPYLPPFKPAYRDLLVTRVILLRPESRGEIRLRSANPTDSARIHQNMLTRDTDWEVLGDGVRLLRELGQQASLRDFIGQETGSTPISNQDSDMRNFLRANANSFRHTLGTCRMGIETDDMAVVDPRLKVRGTEALRVIDASVMPDMVGGNINSAVMMIAERAADLIRGRTTLPAATF
jgi:choline dehydrogenase/4-pyridoxate dehydrogenase